MNEDIHRTVPGVKSEAEAEEIAACIDLDASSPEQMARLGELYNKAFIS